MVKGGPGTPMIAANPCSLKPKAFWLQNLPVMELTPPIRRLMCHLNEPAHPGIRGSGPAGGGLLAARGRVPVAVANLMAALAAFPADCVDLSRAVCLS